MSNLPEGTFRDLDEEEEFEFREWAKLNFNPISDVINEVWHPVVVDECEKILKKYKQDRANA